MVTSLDGVREATILIETRVKPGRDEEFAAWQERMAHCIANAPGYQSHQLMRPRPPAQEDWVVIERFDSRVQARAWLDSPVRAAMIAQVVDLIEHGQEISIVEQPTPSHNEASTAVIFTRVDPDQEDAFRRWNAEITAVQARQPGYRGSTLQAPVEGVQDQWTTFVSFDSAAHLDTWLESDERVKIVAEMTSLARDTSMRRVGPGFEGWFDFPRPEGGGAPPPWKFNYLILVGLYPIVMLEILFLNDKLDWMNLAFGNLIGNIFSVAILGWPVVAILTKCMGWWIQPAPGASKWTDLKGALLMVAVLAALVVGFYFVVTYVGFDAKILKI